MIIELGKNSYRLFIDRFEEMGKPVQLELSTTADGRIGLCKNEIHIHWSADNEDTQENIDYCAKKMLSKNGISQVEKLEICLLAAILGGVRLQ